MNSYEYKDELFPQIRNLPLLPSTKGLRRAESPLFKLRGEHHAHTMGYLALGVPFFPREFSEPHMKCAALWPCKDRYRISLLYLIPMESTTPNDYHNLNVRVF
jgi:hypothetical protein